MILSLSACKSVQLDRGCQCLLKVLRRLMQKKTKTAHADSERPIRRRVDYRTGFLATWLTSNDDILKPHRNDATPEAVRIKNNVFSFRYGGECGYGYFVHQQIFTDTTFRYYREAGVNEVSLSDWKWICHVWHINIQSLCFSAKMSKICIPLKTPLFPL